MLEKACAPWYFIFLTFFRPKSRGWPSPMTLLEFGKLQSLGIKPCLSEGSYQVNGH